MAGGPSRSLSPPHPRPGRVLHSLTGRGGVGVTLTVVELLAVVEVPEMTHDELDEFAESMYDEMVAALDRRDRDHQSDRFD